MSSDVQVKDEPDLEDDFNVDTDSENEEDIEVDKLQPLDSKFALLSKFPIGCKVWYDLCKSTTPTKCLQARSASVAEAYIHFENRKQVYKVKSEITEHESTPLYEDRLVYGANCPVTVTNPDTNEVRNGVIICPKLDPGGDSEGKRRVSYAVQFWQGKKVSIEFGVAADSVKYRMEVKASVDDGRKGGRSIAAEGNEEKDSSDTSKEIGSGELTTNNVGAKISTEAHNSPDQETEDEEEVVETELGVDNNLPHEHGLLEHKRASVTEVDERPKKVAKTTSKESECTCVLIIPSWIEDRRGLFRHILGVDRYGGMGTKTRQITSATTCSIRISGHWDAPKEPIPVREPMTITIQCTNSDATQTRPHVAKAIDMIEESIVEFLPDRDTKKKMLYELAAKATGSYKIPRDHGFVLRKYDGVKKWCTIFDLPEYNHDFQGLTALEKKDCKIEVFDDDRDFISRTAHYVLIHGAKKKDVEEIALEVVNAVKIHLKWMGVDDTQFFNVD